MRAPEFQVVQSGPACRRWFPIEPTGCSDREEWCRRSRGPLQATTVMRSIAANAAVEQRAGELLKQIEPALNQHGKSAKVGTDPSSRKEAATEAGLSERQANP